MSYQKLIVAFDGSEGSMDALHHGINYAKENGAALTVVHVVKRVKDKEIRPVGRPDGTFMAGGNGMYQPVKGPVNPGAQVTEDPKVHVEKVQAKGEETLRHAKIELEKEKIHAETKVLEGDAAEEIDQYALTKEADLIVIGHRGLSGLKKLVQGSVSQKVVEKASCPVLVVK